MKKLLITTILILLSAISLFSQTCEWAERISSDYQSNVVSIAVDGTGKIYTVGYFNSSNITFNNGKSLSNTGSEDAYLAVYNSNGICQWAEKIAGASDDYANSITLDVSGNVYIAGGFNSSTLSFNNGITLNNGGTYDAFIAKYNSSGLCQWAEKISGTDSEVAKSITSDVQGNIYIAGSFTSSVLNFNNGKVLNNIGRSDAFIAKYNPTGICQWAESIGSSNVDDAKSISVDGSGNVIVAGYFVSASLNFNNGISLANSGESDVFIAKYNSSGNCLWAEKIAGLSNDYINNLTLDVSGNVFVAGYFESSTLQFNNSKSINNSGGWDSYIAKYNPSGKCLWAEEIAGSDDDIANYTALDSTGNIYVTGNFASSSLSFNNGKNIINSKYDDAFIAKYNSSGICQWAEKIAGDSSDYTKCIAIDNNDIYVGGEYYSTTLNFNNGKYLNKSGNEEGFLSKYTQTNTSTTDKPIQNNISVYPNPATNYIEIQPSEGSKIQIFNILGEIVLSVEQTPPSVQKINISNLTPGMYFIKIGNKVEKFVKM